ncbi:putative cysteine desulfurase [Polystyrenella longa]|uniref:Cysteine desulfurase n=1 Tax=Polystyrenella longa TaxID=2528007 RepID=A0A518CJG6_9PLAN|nr:SufS family cysteine desulfurase [Polystyrenella longa]QDU79365.1 putative cysteine desulfurase [Polystyrenella longa]
MAPTMATEWNINQVRSDFPILSQKLENGQQVVFLDSAASAQKPTIVLDKEREVYSQYYANAYRGVYEFGAKVDEELETSRETVREFLNANSTNEIVFTSGTTMSLNVVAQAWGRKFLKEGDEVLLNEMEHHANIVPWQMIAQETGAKLRYLPLTEDGQLDLGRLPEFLNERTKVLSVTAMSNMLGTINPLEVLSKAAKTVGAKFVVDAAQYVPHGPIDVQALDIDFLAFSGHKIFGSTGVGILYGRENLLEEMPPLLGGGHMISEVHLDHSTWAGLPAKFEAGTIPIAQAISLGKAINYVNDLGWENLQRHEQELSAYAWEQLQTVPGIKIYGPGLKERGAIFSFTMEGAHPEDIAQLLNRKGVFVRHGHHCTMPLHNVLNITASVRASFAMYNTREEVDALIAALHFTRERLRLNR